MADGTRQIINQKLARFFKVGLHYGHKKKEWNPKMVPFLFYSFPEVDREHHFINLYETQKYLNIFEIEPYEGDLTGTTIIIPYIDEQMLLENNQIEWHTYHISVFDRTFS